jgi:hypothetical protein
MTTLAEARAELHALAERQAKVALRIRRDELVRTFVLRNFAVTAGHRHRDTILDAPTRYATTLAAVHGLSPRALIHALDEILRAELTAMVESAREAECERSQ